MTKIALTTKYSAYNFGAMLQTFALQKTIVGLGGECMVVDADRQHPHGLGSWKSPGQIVLNVAYLRHKNELQTAYSRFDEFMHSYQLSRSYASYDELMEQPPEADVYLTGSDQVWNPLDVRESYFLRYAPKDKVRASYAASMGISYMPEGARRIWCEYLQDIDYLSVREETARRLISEMTGREAGVHVDPVFLLTPEEWAAEAVQPSYGKPYILCYVLYRPAWLNQWLRKVHQETGKDIIVVSTDAYRNIYHTKMIRDAGPREMLGWIQSADFVISSSFHGVALSIANRKPFYAVVNPDAPARIADMLGIFHLEDRIICSNQSVPMTAVDYAKVAGIQKARKAEAMEYLRFLLDRPNKPEHHQERKKRIGTIALVGDHCTGCMVCADVCPTKAISMQVNDEGFAYPVINPSQCVQCSKCLRFCHTIMD